MNNPVLFLGGCWAFYAALRSDDAQHRLDGVGARVSALIVTGFVLLAAYAAASLVLERL